MQNKCTTILSWFAMSKSLITNLDKSAETHCPTIFPNIAIKFFDKAKMKYIYGSCFMNYQVA